MADTPGSETATLASLHDDTKRKARKEVDIREAEAEFNRLRHRLTLDHAQSSTFQPEVLQKDLEKASHIEAEEPFNLREYLSSSNDASQAAGIKHKHVGVTWENLEVTGFGGEDNKARFPFHPPFVFP